ncbi:hypothetical protein QBC37DRAFT_81105 [Rhypophila decipiens]|uniref:Uncharacterized protein n=1 Tax=Rhypophila decipiens TaxID=261697 RepID=A0AAN6YDV8_9PEZI|nr:hypothetical protein QBC37DRAFT_81105 [Rhypophila decipiens]
MKPYPMNATSLSFSIPHLTAIFPEQLIRHTTLDIAMAPEINSTDVTYDPYYKVLVCLKCREVINDALGPHPRHDVRITKESWDMLLPRLNALGFKQNDNPNSRDIKLPEQGSPPIIGVDINSGFQCRLCKKTRRASGQGLNDHVPACWIAPARRRAGEQRKVQWFGSHQTLPVLDPSEELKWPKGKKLAPTNLENEVAKRYLDHYEKRTSQTLPPQGNRSSEKPYWSITVIDMAKRVKKGLSSPRSIRIGSSQGS